MSRCIKLDNPTITDIHIDLQNRVESLMDGPDTVAKYGVDPKRGHPLKTNVAGRDLSYYNLLLKGKYPRDNQDDRGA